MNISENIARIKQGKDDIIKSLKNKGVDIADNTLINEIPTIIDNAEIGGGGDTPIQPDIPELTPKYEGATVFRINVPTDNYEFAINLCNSTTATYDVDWGDGSLEYGLKTNEQHHTYSKSGTYDVNIYNLSKDITLGGSYKVPFGSGSSDTIIIYYLFNNIYNDIWSSYYIQNKDNICTNILIGKGVTSIGEEAFKECYSLQNIVLSDSVTSIGGSAFYNCYSLETVVMSDNLTSIESSAFYNCYSLETVVMSDSVTSIGGSAFYNCYYLQSIVIPDSVTSIGNTTFYSCSSLQNIVLSDNLTSIGSEAFRECSSLQSIVIPDRVASIGSSAFYSCFSLKSVVLPNSLTSITRAIFQECFSLESVVIPDKVTSIADNVFYKCFSLESVVIPNSVTSIGGSVFYACSSLKSVVIPDSVTSIGTSAFEMCYSLSNINIPNSITSIKDRTFQSCYSLQNIVIPNSVTSIGGTAFNSCSSLQSIVIPDSVTSIGSSAFRFCKNLQSVTIPNSIITIQQTTFENCYSLKSVVIPDSVTSIGTSAFNSCSTLQNIVIPNSVTSIGNTAFNNCYSLQSITCNSDTPPTFQSSILPTSGFKYSKRYLYVPKNSLDYDSGNWKSYLIDKGWELRYIEDYPKTPTTLKLKTTNNFFHNLQAIGQANLINYELINDEYIYNFDDKITELIQYTFYNNVLEEIVIPEGVTSLGNYTFQNYYTLQSITFLNPIAPTIQSSTFSNIGTKIPSGTPKVLRVPFGSSGYDSGYWQSTLLDKGYTLEYI
jgi:hypothetical protein